MSDFVVGVLGAIVLWMIGSWVLQEPSPFKNGHKDDAFPLLDTMEEE
tara:strand:+ start:286 stop:426 length:141 start_codon:yes stop_codon:yes gene_type:complete